MIGYCQDLGINVEMENVQTIQMPDLSFVQEGTFTKRGKVYKVFRVVNSDEILVTTSGKFFPKEVYVGPRTPKNLLKEKRGQDLIEKGKRIRLGAREGLKSLREKIREVKNA